MKRKIVSRFLLICASVFLLLNSVLPVNADGKDLSRSYMDAILQENVKASGASSIQEWIDQTLAPGAGNGGEWYIITLAQSGGYDLTSYVESLKNYLSEHRVPSASTRLKYALTFASCFVEETYISSTLSDSIGQQGIMSELFGLHLLNNGYTCSEFTKDGVIDLLLKRQLSDGGWALFGTYGDVDVTAMTIQALAPSAKDSRVKEAVDRALALLSSRQLSNGGFSSFGTENPESAAQVLFALSSLGIDCETDERFLKDGHSIFDGIAGFRLENGLFSHLQNGEANAMASQQVFYACASYLRMKEGKGPLYLFETMDVPQPPDPDDPDNPDSSVSLPATEPDTSSDPASEETVPSSGVVPPSDGETSFSESQTPSPGQKTAENAKTGPSYKLYACIGVVLLGGAACLVLFLLKKWNYKNYLLVIGVVLVLIAGILLTNIRSAEEFYSVPEKTDAIGTASFSISCKTVSQKSDKDYIPKDGVIFPETALPVNEGDTVYDLLVYAVREKGIQMETKGAGELVYVSGIQYLYEMDFGDLSGWMYRVNGETPSVGCAAYTVKPGDRVEWLYTCDLGNDLE